eukprot:10791434-Heterocapsa_arctica.AAC.1
MAGPMRSRVMSVDRTQTCRSCMYLLKAYCLIMSGAQYGGTFSVAVPTSAVSGRRAIVRGWKAQ